MNVSIRQTYSGYINSTKLDIISWKAFEQWVFDNWRNCVEAQIKQYSGL